MHAKFGHERKAILLCTRQNDAGSPLPAPQPASQAFAVPPTMIWFMGCTAHRHPQSIRDGTPLGASCVIRLPLQQRQALQLPQARRNP